MRNYTIKQMTGKPDWALVPTLPIDNRYFDTPLEITAQAQIAYNEDALWVRLSTVEERIRAIEVGPLGSPCEDSCLEFFFCPMEGDNRYFNIEFNVNGCLYLGFGSYIGDLVRLLPSEEPLLSPNIHRTASGWEIEYEIPYSFIRRFFPDFTAFSGKHMRANCYKCADFSTPPHYMAWSPIVGEPFKFHRPECFGEMIFE